jgi:hypothetical protein
MAKARRKMTTEELADDLRVFQHREAALRLRKLSAILKARGICEHCGRDYDECERQR